MIENSYSSYERIPKAFQEVIRQENGRVTSEQGDMRDTRQGNFCMVHFPSDLDLTKYDLQPEDLPIGMSVKGNLTISARDFDTIVHQRSYDFHDLIIKGPLPHAASENELTKAVERSASAIGGRVRFLLGA
jgi:hypothetical protein